MVNINKKLACGLWAVAGIWTLVTLITNLPYGVGFGLILALVAHVFQFLLGYTIWRDRNDTFTMVSVILIAVFTFNLGGLLAIIFRLIIRKNNSESIRNLWYLPAVVSAGLALLTSLAYLNLFTFLGLAINAAYYLLFGYWFIKYLK